MGQRPTWLHTAQARKAHPTRTPPSVEPARPSPCPPHPHPHPPPLFHRRGAPVASWTASRPPCLKQRLTLLRVSPGRHECPPPTSQPAKGSCAVTTPRGAGKRGRKTGRGAGAPPRRERLPRWGGVTGKGEGDTRCVVGGGAQPRSQGSSKGTGGGDLCSPRCAGGLQVGRPEREPGPSHREPPARSPWVQFRGRLCRERSRRAPRC